ncbi:MAG TPA: response regulator transcription factor [Bryobacteraceae bacterium]|nr:response regulator transcription factor [Bryobacteraceae bacterium]
MKIRVVIADDHVILRDALAMMLERHGDLQVVGMASDGREAIRVVEDLRPDVATIDVSMPVMNGLEAVRALKSAGVATRLVILTMHNDPAFMREAARAGAVAHLQKSAGPEELIEAIRQAHRGVRLLQCDEDEATPPQPLTDREKEVLQLIVEGKTRREVAASLGISVGTVNSHLQRIQRRLQVSTTFELIRCAIREGLVANSFGNSVRPDR